MPTVSSTKRNVKVPNAGHLNYYVLVRTALFAFVQIQRVMLFCQHQQAVKCFLRFLSCFLIVRSSASPITHRSTEKWCLGDCALGEGMYGPRNVPIMVFFPSIDTHKHTDLSVSMWRFIKSRCQRTNNTQCHYITANWPSLSKSGDVNTRRRNVCSY